MPAPPATVPGVPAPIPIRYRETELPQDACQSGRVMRFGKTTPPIVTSSSRPFASGLSPKGRLISAARTTPSFYGTPLVAWESVLGAQEYEIQWSKSANPWRPLGSLVTGATSSLLPLEPGTWYYRVRGYNHSLLKRPQMAWSTPTAAEGLEAHLRGRQGWSLGSPSGARRRPRVRALPRRRRRHDLHGALPRRRPPRRDEARPDARVRGGPARRVDAAGTDRARTPRRGRARRGGGRRQQSDGTAGWIIDPIDGTRNYTRGIPIWATLIAFEDRVAVVSAPALGRRWWAKRGQGAYANGQRIHVSAIDRLEDATLLYALDRPVPERAWDAWHLRGFGDFWAHMLVAEGAAEVAVDALGLARLGHGLTRGDPRGGGRSVRRSRLVERPARSQRAALTAAS